MDGSEKRRDSTAQTAAILADMGIQVWFERGRQAPAADAPAPAPEERPVQEVQTAREVRPVQEPRPVPASSPAAAQVPLPETVAVVPPPVQSSSAAPSSEIIEFSWLKNSHGLIAYPLGVDATAARMLKDILAYASWLSDPAGKQASGRYASGDFRWPQLVDSGGNPLRALRAFLDKHFAAQPARILVTAEVAPMLDKWLVELAHDTSLTVVELPALQDGIGNPASKKQIWQMMRGAR